MPGKTTDIQEILDALTGEKDRFTGRKAGRLCEEDFEASVFLIKTVYSRLYKTAAVLI